jgi:hypothetical protein
MAPRAEIFNITTEPVDKSSAEPPACSNFGQLVSKTSNIDAVQYLSPTGRVEKFQILKLCSIIKYE